MKKIFLFNVLFLLAACVSQSVSTPVDNCGVQSACGATSYTVSTPVEVIYKKETFTTVYEPRTYKRTSYERRPYNGCNSTTKICR